MCRNELLQEVSTMKIKIAKYGRAFYFYFFSKIMFWNKF